MAAASVVSEVRSVHREQRKVSTVPCGAPRAADHHIRHTSIMEPHILWSVDEVVNGPCSQVTVNSSSIQLPSQQLMMLEALEKGKKHDPDSALEV